MSMSDPWVRGLYEMFLQNEVSVEEVIESWPSEWMSVGGP